MKKVLIVSNNILPILNGSCQVIYEYCRILKDLGCELHFCHPYGTISSLEQERFFDNHIHIFHQTIFEKYSFSSLLKKIHYLLYKKGLIKFCNIDDLYPNGLGQYVERLHKKIHFDICFVNYIKFSNIFTYSSIPQKVLYTHDIFTFKKELIDIKDFGYCLSPNQEAKGVRRATHIFSIQEKESNLLHYYHPKGITKTVYSFFPIHKQTLSYNQNILYIGSNNTANYNGIVLFIKSSLPLILRNVPNAKLLIAGSICARLMPYECDYLRLLGKVNDLEEFYSQGDIVINPTYQGTGLKVKTFEALSYGKSVIVDNHSTEGIYQEWNAPLLIATNAEDFAKKCINILRDNEKRSYLSNKSIDYINSLNQYVIKQYKKLVEL